jgi:hypothetical protein
LTVLDGILDVLLMRLDELLNPNGLFDPVTNPTGVQPVDYYSIVDRALRPQDPNKSIGLFSVDWVPDLNSLEMQGPDLPAEPTMQRYNFRIQNYIRSADKTGGGRLFANDAKNVRAILYRDAELGVRLRAIEEDTLGSREHVKRYGVRTQRYLNNEFSGTFVFLATTEFWIDTETVPA